MMVSSVHRLLCAMALQDLAVQYLSSETNLKCVLYVKLLYCFD